MGNVIVAEGSRGMRVEFDGETIRHVGSTLLGSKRIDERFSVSDVEGASVHVYPLHLATNNFQFVVSGKVKVVTIDKQNREPFDEIVRQISARWRAFEAIAANLPRKLDAITVAPETAPSTPGVVTRTGLRLGEISRNFDSKTLGTISGFMHHSLGFEGWSIGLSAGRFGLGIGSLGLSGTSTVQLTASEVTRTDMLNDGFVAVFESEADGDVDTLRLVAPSDEASRAVLDEAIQTINVGMKPGKRFSPAALERLISKCQSLISTEVSYASDRLNSVLRADNARSRRFAVVGVELSPHSLLGGAIQFPGDSAWHQLFPIALMRMLGGEELAGLDSGHTEAAPPS